MENKELNIKEFGDRLRSLLEEKRIEQKELAKAVGVAKSTLNSYVLGSARPSLEVVYKIAKTLNISVDYLLGLSDNPYLDVNDSPVVRDAKMIRRNLQEVPDEERRLLVELSQILQRKHKKRTVVLKR